MQLWSIFDFRKWSKTLFMFLVVVHMLYLCLDTYQVVNIFYANVLHFINNNALYTSIWLTLYWIAVKRRMLRAKFCWGSYKKTDTLRKISDFSLSFTNVLTLWLWQSHIVWETDRLPNRRQDNLLPSLNDQGPSVSHNRCVFIRRRIMYWIEIDGMQTKSKMHVFREKTGD